MLVHEFLENTARRLPDKEALIFQSQRLTYRQVNELSNQFAHSLLHAGLQRGDRVAIFMDNSIESVISIFGILKAGGIFSILSPTLKTKKLNYILSHLDASFLVTHSNRLSLVVEASEQVDSLYSIIVCGKPKQLHSKQTYIPWNDFISSSPKINPKTPCIDIDLANIIYTSGTTADPKGIMMTHLNVSTAATSIIQYLKNTEDDIIIDVLPLSFDYGLYQVLMCFKFGGTLVLEQSFIYPYVVIEKIVKEKVTGFPGVPTMFAMLLRLKNLEKFDLSSLRYFSNTAAAFPMHHIRQLRQKFPHIDIYSMYGLSECKRVSYLPPEEIDRRTDSVGIAMPNTEVFIVDENGNKVGPRKAGELVVRGAHVMKGYWRDPEETKKRLKPGIYPDEKLLYTGDLFRMDKEGFLYFVSRKDDIIKTRGERVSPKEVENVLHEIDGVIEAAVISVPDEILGNAIKSFIVKDHGIDLSEKDVLAYCTKNLETFMVPKYVEFVKSFKKTSSGKIDKKQLK